MHEDIVTNVNGFLTVRGSASAYDIMDTRKDFDLQVYDEYTVIGFLMYRLGHTPVGGDEVSQTTCLSRRSASRATRSGSARS